MNKDTIDGNLKQVKGSVKEALGKVTGNKRLEVEGAAEKLAGKAQEGVGKTQDAAKDAVDKLRK
ncbi:CsbD family protein [Variovorax gossypii]